MSMKMKNEDGAWLPADAATFMDFEQGEPPRLVGFCIVVLARPQHLFAKPRTPRNSDDENNDEDN